ncbi:MAG: peptidoglycan-associated lipoprotein Pal [Gammaproteobacteria bacterium]|nr:peptidoglycan-associated lipoprotein Pal [Gammaproteobacteria bacterium]
MSYLKFIAVGLVVVLLSGCSSPSVPDPEPTDTTYGGSDATTDGMGDRGMGDGEFLDDPTAGELGMIIYFDFDSSEVRPKDHDLVSRHAMQVSNNMNRKIRLEGHADERGSREYNIGLGERRSQAVRQMLMIQGVSASQISTVSFGEERPASFGSSESDYAQNRRVEIKYTN